MVSSRWAFRQFEICRSIASSEEDFKTALCQAHEVVVGKEIRHGMESTHVQQTWAGARTRAEAKVNVDARCKGQLDDCSE